MGFCHTSTGVSHRCTYVLSLLNLLPTPLPHLMIQGIENWNTSQILKSHPESGGGRGQGKRVCCMCQALGWALGLCRPTGPCDHSPSLEERTHTHTHTHTHKHALETTEQGTEEAPKTQGGSMPMAFKWVPGRLSIRAGE